MQELVAELLMGINHLLVARSTFDQLNTLPADRNPYLLPNAVGAGVSLLSLPLVYSFLKETLTLDDGSQG